MNETIHDAIRQYHKRYGTTGGLSSLFKERVILSLASVLFVAIGIIAVILKYRFSQYSRQRIPETSYNIQDMFVLSRIAPMTPKDPEKKDVPPTYDEVMLSDLPSYDAVVTFKNSENVKQG